MSNNISRRKITQGIAWSVPAIAATVAAPLAAASPSLCDTEDLWRNRRPADSFVTSIDPEGVITIAKPADWKGDWNPTVSVTYFESGITTTGELGDDVVTVTTPDGVTDPFDIETILYEAEGAPTQVLYRKWEWNQEGEGTLSCEIEYEVEPTAPSFCDTRDLWMNKIPPYLLHPISIDANGIVTITKPAGWKYTWPPNLTVSYIGTDATATVKPGADGDTVIATPPAGVNPFDIEKIESEVPGSTRTLFRDTDWAGNYLCSISTTALEVH